MQMLAERAGEVDGNAGGAALLVDHLKRRIGHFHADPERARPFRTAGRERQQSKESEAEKRKGFSHEKARKAQDALLCLLRLFVAIHSGFQESAVIQSALAPARA